MPLLNSTEASLHHQHHHQHLPSPKLTGNNSFHRSSSTTLKSTSNNGNRGSWNVEEKKKKSEHHVYSLMPLKENFSNSTSSSMNLNHRGSIKLKPMVPSSTAAAATAAAAQPKKQKSNSLSIIDYCNIMNANTNYQIFANFSNLSDDVFEEVNTTHNSANGSVTAGNSAQIHKQAGLSEQMAALFGSNDCKCLLCSHNNESSNCKSNQMNIEIIPNKHNSDYSVIKYTYSSPLSQLSPLKLFNMFNCDCSISINGLSEHRKCNSSSDVNSAFTSNIFVSTSPNSGSNLPSINGISSTSSTGGSHATHANSSFSFDNSNNPPIYDSRYMYLIDCRLSKKAYDKSHINTAIHFSDLLNDSVYLSPPVDNFTVIVLYDEDGTFLTSSSSSSFAASSLKRSSTSSSASHTNYYRVRHNSHSSAAGREPLPSHHDPVLFDSETCADSDDIITNIRKKIKCSLSKTVYILSGGYEQFSKKFPFMCSSMSIRSTVDRHKYLTIYPNSVIENQVYIGSGVQAKNWKIIRDLQITHIINCSIEHECVFQDELSYLWVKLEDSYQEDIYKSLVKAYKFMENAFAKYYEECEKYEENKASRSRSSSSSGHSENNESSMMRAPQKPVFMIHCNLGISRSSSILIAYLIARYKVCLYQAFKYVKDKRLQIAPNYSFLRQLKHFEEDYF